MLERSLRELCPTIRPALQGACIALEEGGVLRLRLAPGCLDMLGDGSALRRAEAAFSQAYGLEVRVLAETDEGLEPLKLPEKPDFSQAAVQATGRCKKKPAENPGAEQGPRVLYGKRIQEKDRIPQDQVSEDVGRVVIGGEITSLEVKETKNGSFIVNFAISDHTNTLPCKLFIKEKDAGQKLQAELEATKKQGDWLLVQGDYTMDEFMRRMCVHVRNIGAFTMPKRMDTAKEKRVELHLHTKMSTMDGLTNVKEAVATAARWGHRAIAITDHGVVHAFPDAVSAADKLTKAGQEIKAILGVEGYLLPDCRLAERPETYVALGVTRAPAFRLDDLFEIAALRITPTGEVLDTFYRTVDCGALLPPELALETGLTQEALAGGVSVKDALSALSAFMAGGCPVAFGPEALALLHAHGLAHGMELPVEYVDLSVLSHDLFNPLFPERFLIARVLTLPGVTGVVVVYGSGLTGAAFPVHRASTMAAEQFSGQEVIYLSLAPCRGFCVR